MPKLTREIAIAKFEKVHGSKYGYKEVIWVDRKTPVCIVCPKHGRFYQTYETHAANKAGCKACALANRKKVLFTEKGLEALRQIYPSSATRVEVMAALPNRSWRAILEKAKRLGLSTDRQYKRPNRLGHLLDQTTENAYLWGLLYADGWLSEDHGFIVSLHKQDEIFLKAIGVRYNLGETKPADSIGVMRKLRVQDAARIRKLKALLDYHEKKTYNPPTHFRFLATPEMRLAFFIGLVDGDGHVQVALNGNFRCIRILMHHNWFPFLEALSKQLTLDTGITFTVNTSNSRSNAYLYMGKMASFRFLTSFIKKHDLPVMTRKWQI